MMMMLRDAVLLLPGATLVGDAGTAFERVHSDTRTLRAGDLFVALRGERFDGHDFLPAARAAGAVAALAEHGLSDAMPGLQVPDALAALQQLAAAWRQRFTLPLVAVTGSNGKTTVTQMVASILRAEHGDAAFATEGNLNNHIGVPLTLLRLRQDARTWHRAGVVELGMNHAGEIAQLAALAAPTVVLVNNAQREHQEFMDSVEAVARENGSALSALPPDGTAVLPAGAAYTEIWRRLAGSARVLDFGLDSPADVGGSAHWSDGRWTLELQTPAGAVGTTLRAAGRHNVLNALAASACALAAGASLQSVAAGLAAFEPVAGRSQTQTLRRGRREVVLVDDSYNANPDSVLAAIDVLASLPAPRWLLLGDMGEVGSRGPEFHAEVGTYARQRGIDWVWAAGALCVHAGATRHFADVPSLLAALDAPGSAPAAASILVKGSRFMAMERVVHALRQGAG